MEIIKRTVSVFVLLLAFVACKNESKETEVISESIEDVKDTIEVVEKPVVKTMQQIKEELNTKGFKTFDYVDEKTQDTILMQQYFMAFLKSGPIRSQNEEEAELLQEAHLNYLGKMYELGYADISGPFGDDGDIRGITIYNVPTQKMADSLANADPMVKAGRLIVEIHPWWAAKGFSLR
ncbi:YciI family protein [Aestuariibaculum lutulentum]|uniref:YciI family protein n=1 Tax=Aestuariibaculum lutulentum TaxID=2920935 RepID=A0ABS9RJL5_9FLAO|nr:YciI family protein [Aestuariibaculum lutulentum]MCH4552297.1 YciI family protein [Aestuariibaculum lutulentum]